MKSVSHGKQLSRMLLLGFIAFVCVGSLIWWVVSRYYVSTDNAYVNANVVQISARVTGSVTALPVRDNQQVKAGDLLFALDPAVFQANFSNAEAQVDRAKAELSIAGITAERTKALVQKHVASTQEGDIAQAKLKSAEANLAVAEARMTSAHLQLQYTRIVAPVSGWISRLSLRIGDVVTATQPVFALVSNEGFWVDANFRETELAAILVGQTVTVHVDMYPGHAFRGEVESISSGTGAVFSLLPPENATGNWVKVTQRVPVKIRILDPDPEFPLRIGSSATVSISLHAWSA